MTLKAAKTWFLRLLPVVLFFICYYCSQFYFESYGGSGKSPLPTVSLCHNYRLQRKWESLKLNMSRKTELFLKLGDFFWREHVSAEALPYGIKGSELLLLKVLAMTSSYTMPANIERLNDAPVRGYEEDVGNKTTLRLFYPESASYNPGIHNDPGTLLALVPFKQQDLRWLKEILYDEKRVRKGFWKPPPQIWLGRASQIRVLDPYFLRLTASKLLQIIPLQPRRQQKLVHPTSGILAVFVALNYCDVVHVAGFGYPESRNQKQPIHYYGKETMKSMKNSYHDLNQEALVLKRLEDQGAILYLHPHS
ncbi:CMP-N-acetylneuraminate-beta-galactosamide-alpha-2,3-sialyltransferase 4-like isoform X3 [Sinocyclocheilus grahami]|uniref:CMP-N-acetylneuraminate-beta-galactosamide- alpha-2,3-sialyltransferase 4-like isoform X3 n=1 Tax=Sinocyclocheilus grahami TaxID=75366 RepID=UPI0007AD525D|nr:PREDICTED: CMP-N-acetylneuraminate-beta-galactosamide-alpha-2,3-sialyltransferase 4-like isoform X3 [Sinocyclocheilus grahami]